MQFFRKNKYTQIKNARLYSSQNDQLQNLRLRYTKLCEFQKTHKTPNNTPEVLHALQIIEGTIPYSNHLLSIAENAYTLLQTETRDEWIRSHVITMNVQIALTKDLIDDADVKMIILEIEQWVCND